MSKITHLPKVEDKKRRVGLQAKLWPNGEISIHRPKKLRERPVAKEKPEWYDSLGLCLLRAYGVEEARKIIARLGLSSVANSDKSEKPSVQYGLKGITSLGRRRVRNACYVMRREVGKHRLTFATVTVPDLSAEQMGILHVSWHKVIEFYRREVRRVLIRQGLPGEIVGVTEIQEKRYEKQGFPVLHAHFVFVGRSRTGGWVLSPRKHDYIWRKSIQSVLGSAGISCASACNLQAVEKNAESYLSKYMSKGSSVVQAVIDDGFEWALPRQWWNCSRSMVNRIERQMKHFGHGVDWLISRLQDGAGDVWQYYCVVEIETKMGDKIAVGSYGRLLPAANSLIRKVLNL